MATIEPFAFSTADAARFTGLGLTKIKALLRAGALPFHKAGRRTLILRCDLESYVRSLSGNRTAIPRGDGGKFASESVKAVHHA